jgi:hypothetical protein
MNSTPTELLAEIGRHEIERQKRDSRLEVLALALRQAANDRKLKTDIWWAMLASTVADMMLEQNCGILGSVAKYMDEIDEEVKVGA